MIVLGIESSCDDTGVAIVKDGREVLASHVASQLARHAPFGGVVPEIAAREHLQSIHPLFERALADSGLAASAIDAIAVTQGPGLIGALLVGVSYAKGLGLALNRPVVPVDHVHAHVHGALLGLPQGLSYEEDLFPCLALVISGGHCNLYYMADPTSFSLLAATIDDACGECFDKVAKMMGLPYPGGPVIEALARQGRADRFAMPKMVAEKSRLAFSYSGLKTHVIQLLKRMEQPLGEEDRADLCAAFQEEALGQIIRKLEQARLQCPKEPRAVLVAGGVAANQRFRQMIRDKIKGQVYFPELKYCSDNAAMIAAYGWHEYHRQSASHNFANHDWDAYARYRFEAVLAGS